MERALRALEDAFRKLRSAVREKVRGGMIYLRELGFGFGFRYTPPDEGALPKAPTSENLVRTLDAVDNYQQDLAMTSSWAPDLDETDGAQSAKRSSVIPRLRSPG